MFLGASRVWYTGSTIMTYAVIESNLTIQDVAQRLGISLEAACVLVVASLTSSRARAQ